MIPPTPKPLAFLAAALLGGVSVLAAGLGSAASINWDNNYRTGVGGEFTLVDTGLDFSAYSASTAGVVYGPDSFQTFCIEYNEHISKGQSVTFNTDSGARNGGVSGGNPDYVSIGTAYLYSQFAAGTLALYDYTAGSGRQSAAGELQNAIWYLEGERTLLEIGGTNAYVTLVTGLFLDPTADANGSYNVSAVNLFDSSTGEFLQDQLYVSPGASTNVPDGGTTVLLLGLGLAGLAGGRRFLSKKAR